MKIYYKKKKEDCYWSLFWVVLEKNIVHRMENLLDILDLQ